MKERGKGEKVRGSEREGARNSKRYTQRIRERENVERERKKGRKEREREEKRT